MPVKDLARSDVVTAQPDTPVSALATTMAEESVGSIVITEEKTPVGIVTDRDLAIRVLAHDDTTADATAADVMTPDPQTVDREAGFYAATRMMNEFGIRRIPVCDDDTLVGIITTDDLSELLSDEQQELANVIRAQRPEY